MAEGYDFIIVGSGVGGLTAALAAKSAGLNPLVLEKTDKIGGNSAMSGGVFWCPANHVLEQEGIPDSIEAGNEYLANAVGQGGAGTTKERTAAFLRGTPEMLRFLDSQGIKFRRQVGRTDYYDDLPGGSSIGRSVETDLYDVDTLGAWKDKLRLGLRKMPIRSGEAARISLMRRTLPGFMMAARFVYRSVMDRVLRRSRTGFGGAMMGRILEACLRKGVEIRVSASVRQLIVEDGKVCGVIVDEDGKRTELRASQGVLIAAGGFARNAEMREKYLPTPAPVEWTFTNPGETGDMIAEAAGLGAALDQMDQMIYLSLVKLPDAGAYYIMGELQKPFGIVVDQGGERFCNEACSYMEFGQKMYERNKVSPAIPCWFIMDARARRYYPFGTTPPGRIPRKWIESGFMRVNKTLAGLAVDCGIDPQTLEKTVARFNRFAHEGVDHDFGRGNRNYDRVFGDPTVKPNPSLGAIERGPFMAVAVYPGDVGTFGGIVTDEYARVLREDGTVIEGLFATGTATASVVGDVYPGAGASISASATFGYIAARYCAGIIPNFEPITRLEAA